VTRTKFHSLTIHCDHESVAQFSMHADWPRDFRSGLAAEAKQTIPLTAPCTGDFSAGPCEGEGPAAGWLTGGRRVRLG